MGKQKKITTYDKTELYNTKVAPEVEKIRVTCAAGKLPFFFSSAVKNDEEGTVYKNEGVLTGSFGIDLKEDHFENFLGVLHGGKVVFDAGDPDVSAEERVAYLQDASFEDDEPVIQGGEMTDIMGKDEAPEDEKVGEVQNGPEQDSGEPVDEESKMENTTEAFLGEI